MAHQPFTSECTNIFNETIYNTIPNAFGLNNVNATQAHNRSLFDTVSTYIAAANSQPQMQMPTCYQCHNLHKPQVIYAQPRPIPNGVNFTFNPNPVPPQQYNIQAFDITGPKMNPYLQMQQAQQQPYQQQQEQQSLTLQQQMAFKQLEQQGLELLLLQEHLKKSPFKLQFHHNQQTSTTDLLAAPSQVPPSQGMPDLKSALGALEGLGQDIANIGIDKLPSNCAPNALYEEVYKTKRLMLTKSPDILNKTTREERLHKLGNENECTEPQESQSVQQDISKSDKHRQTPASRVSFEDKKPRQPSKKPRQPSKKPTRGKKHSKSSRNKHGRSGSESSEEDDGNSDSESEDEDS